MPGLSSWSVPHWARSESVGELVVKLQDAFRRGDRLAIARRVYRLNQAVQRFDSMCRRRGCRDPAELAEARQRILLRLYAVTQRHSELAIENGDAFARTAAEWELGDLARERSRREVPLDRAAAMRALERWSTHGAEDLAAKLEGERVLEDARRVFTAHLAHYRAVAAQKGRGRLAGQHVAAWFMLRVQGLPATEVARALGVERMAGGGRAVVWQWAKRGGDVVLEIAHADPDRERARIMRAAAGGDEASLESDRRSAG